MTRNTRCAACHRGFTWEEIKSGYYSTVKASEYQSGYMVAVADYLHEGGTCWDEYYSGEYI